MHAANAAGGEEADAGHVGNDHGCGNGGSAVLTPGAQHGQVPAGSLVNGAALLAEVLDLLSGQTGLQAAADDGDGSRHSTVLADDLLNVQSGFHVLGVGHTVGDDGGFQGNNGLAVGQSLSDFGIDVQILVHVHSCTFLSFLKKPCYRCIRLRRPAADMAELMVSEDSMAMEPAARPARAVSRRVMPSR